MKSESLTAVAEVSGRKKQKPRKDKDIENEGVFALACNPCGNCCES